jgi:hypothetical protein
MRRTWHVVAGCIAVVSVFAGEAAGITGNEYRALSPLARLSYVVGVVDGWETVGILGAIQNEPQPSFVTKHTDLARCPIDRQMTRGQTQAIVDKYIADHPADWNYRAAQLVFLAMYEACKP